MSEAVERVYELLLRGQTGDALEALRGEPKMSDASSLVLKALSLTLSGDFNGARKLLSGFEALDLSEREEAIGLEAQALLADRASSSDAEVLARRATEVHAGSVYANRLLAKILENQGARQEALAHYQSALSRFPESHRTILDIAKLQIALNRLDEARKTISQAGFSVRREILRLAAGRRQPLGLAVAIGAVLLMLVDQTHFIALALLLAAALAAFGVAVRDQDGVSLSLATWFLAIVAVSEGLRWVLPRLGAL